MLNAVCAGSRRFNCDFSAGRCRKWPTFHYHQRYDLEIDRFYCDPAAIYGWKFCPQEFCVNLCGIHISSFWTGCKSFKLDTRALFNCCLVHSVSPGLSKQCLHNGRTIAIILSLFSSIELPNLVVLLFNLKITSKESMKPKLLLIDCYSIRTINITHMFSHLATFP